MTLLCCRLTWVKHPPLPPHLPQSVWLASYLTFSYPFSPLFRMYSLLVPAAGGGGGGGWTRRRQQKTKKLWTSFHIQYSFTGIIAAGPSSSPITNDQNIFFLILLQVSSSLINYTRYCSGCHRCYNKPKRSQLLDMCSMVYMKVIMWKLEGNVSNIEYRVSLW